MPKVYSKIRLFLTGLVMGIADLIPGISGGTVALMCGIYEPLLESIKTLQFQSFNKISWPFLIPLFSGIALSILLFSKIIYLLLIHFHSPLFGLFFGMIAASTLLCGYEAKMAKAIHSVGFIGGATVALCLTSLSSDLVFEPGFFGVVFAAMLATAAMLLPGISGGFVLQIVGVYPLTIAALNSPTEPASLKLLITMGIGISLGFVVFSHSISYLLKYFKQITLSILTGFMTGGLKVLWPFTSTDVLVPLMTLFLGFFLIIFPEINKIRSNKATVS